MLDHNGRVLELALTGVGCLVAGVLLLRRPADQKSRQGCRTMGAILLLICAFGLGLCSALVWSL